MSRTATDTPLMQQHRAIKQKYPDAILLFRVGDFYETFGSDAIKASEVLGITLTKRNNGAAASSELAGFPHHALDTYLHKLVKSGYRVAICDQLEDPKLAKGIVKRGVTEMVTPGIATHEKLLDHQANNYLAGIHFNEHQAGLAFLDISTGEFFVAEGDLSYADKLLQALRPSEIIFSRSAQKLFKETFGSKFYTYALENWVFEEAYATEILLKQFQTHSLKGFGIEHLHQGIIAAGAILHYLKDTEHPHLRHLTTLQRIERDEHLWMDRFTIRNLELVQSASEQGPTLLKVIDHTVSPMGARLLKRWVLMPLTDWGKIRDRLDGVEFLVLNNDLRQGLIHSLKLCGDLERLAAKIALKKINPREVLQIARALEQVELIRKNCSAASQPLLNRLADALNPCKLAYEKITGELQENPPAVLIKGEVFREGVHTELDQLRKIAYGGKEYLVQLQQQEAEKTGISSLKISYNNVFGYYLEVTHTHKNKVPETWIRKQTLTNAERYITPELKTYEEQITGAEEKISALEQQLYDQLLLMLQDYIAPLQTNGALLAQLDILCCFAQNALQYQYRKPVLTDQGPLVLKDSRHPVIERYLPVGEPYIANDLELDTEKQQIIILTGPNMSGKSALLRQTALITLLAHIGSFVPASSAEIPLTDKIFTRVGASDNLSGGESTFMVEMTETASILNNLSRQSLILLDEIGRGTSTYDGISIAWSIAEYLHEHPCRPKTLFATHYHELNELENSFSRIRNFHITNQEVGNKVIFLRKLASGGSTHSFGIHVAKLAGMPVPLIQKANDILSQLEALHGKEQLGERIETRNARVQLSIFDSHSELFQQIREMLQGIDINRLTPVEALLKLNEIKKLLQ